MIFIAALRHDPISAPWVIDGPINGELGRSWTAISCLAVFTRWRSSHWCGGRPVEIRNTREK